MKIDLDPDGADFPVLTATVSFGGERLDIMAEPERVGSRLLLKRLHIHAKMLKPNVVGWTHLRQLARLPMEESGIDELVVEGATRTTGAGQGRTPAVVRFTRARPLRTG